MSRENNLNDVTVELPKRRLTVCTGVSGSGKSSLIFGTIAAESQRLVNETYSTFVQGFMPSTTRPEVDRLEGLTTTIAIDQESLPANPRSTVGTVTDVHALLRMLFSRVGTPHIGGPQAFAFNVASVQASGSITVQKGDKPVAEHRDFSLNGGMCATCEGRGSVSDFALTELRCAQVPGRWRTESARLLDGGVVWPLIQSCRAGHEQTHRRLHR